MSEKGADFLNPYKKPEFLQLVVALELVLLAAFLFCLTPDVYKRQECTSSFRTRRMKGVCTDNVNFCNFVPGKGFGKVSCYGSADSRRPNGNSDSKENSQSPEKNACCCKNQNGSITAGCEHCSRQDQKADAGPAADDTITRV